MSTENMLNTKEWDQVLADFNKAKKWVECFLPSNTNASENTGQLTQEEHREKQANKFLRYEILSSYFENPERSYASIHVAGTSGKGSTTTMVDAILSGAGISTGRYTSPYMQIPNEKIALSQKMIKPSEFVEIVDEIRSKFEEFTKQNPNITITYSEIWQLIAFSYFKKKHIDWLALETSVGGRYDSSNVSPSSVAIITNIGYDHMPDLGTTLEEIAWHKAGIIKPGKPAVTTETNSGALQVIIDEALEKKSPLYILNKDFFVNNIHNENNGVLFDLKTPFGSFEKIYISLAGNFQAYNAAAAIMACLIAAKGNGFLLNEQMIRESLQSVSYGGRMEKMQEHPTVLIDGAHNPQKMKAAMQALQELYPDREKILVIGMLKAKDATKSIEAIIDNVKAVVTTSPKIVAKPAYPPEEICKIVSGLDGNIPVATSESIEEAVKLGMKLAGTDAIVFVTGSIYMLEQVRSMWYPKEELLRALEYS